MMNPKAAAALLTILSESSDDNESSSDEEDMDYAFEMFAELGNQCKRGTLRKIPRIQSYVETTVMQYNTTEFKSHFR